MRNDDTTIAIRWLRKLVALCIPIQTWIDRHTELVTWLTLLVLVPASVFCVKLQIGRSEFSIITLFAVALPCLTVITALLLFAKRIDMFTRSIGGLKLADLHDLCKPLVPYTVSFADEDDIPEIAKLADDYFLGTMPAGSGPSMVNRLQHRTAIYRRRISGYKRSFLRIEDASGALVGFTLIYPVSQLATERYLGGRLSYTDLDETEMQNDREGASVYIAVVRATTDAISRQEKIGLDLLGQVIIRHLADVKKTCKFSKLRIITSGNGYWANKAFRKKGFIKTRKRDRDGLVVLILDQTGQVNEVGIQFLREIERLSREAEPIVETGT